LAFCFRVDDSIAKGTKRIARTQMDRALEQLTLQTQAPQEEAVHDARKRFKRIRALLRLVRESIGKRRYKKENACFRDAGRPLAEVRDSRVLVTAFEDLVRCFVDQVPGLPVADIAQSLGQRQEAVSKRLFDEEKTLAEVATILKRAQRRLKKWSFAKDDRFALHTGLKRVYQRGLEAVSSAVSQCTTENLHEWRKRVKDLWHELQLLEPLWPAITAELVKQVHTLADYLGADHDLAVLRAALAEDACHLGSHAALEALLPLIDRRRSELQHAAFSLGQLLFRDKPKAFLRRLEPKR
jgi:CHAD domain-containing protein